MDKNVFSYELFVEGSVMVSLENYYSFYAPTSPYKVMGFITHESIRDLLLLTGLFMAEDCVMQFKAESVEWSVDLFTNKVNISEEIGGREQAIEKFIQEHWGFYSCEMGVSDWVNHIESVISQLNPPLLT